MPVTIKIQLLACCELFVASVDSKMAQDKHYNPAAHGALAHHPHPKGTNLPECLVFPFMATSWLRFSLENATPGTSATWSWYVIFTGPHAHHKKTEDLIPV